MGKSRVKGITVQIGGDVTGLDKALSGVNKNIGTTQSKLQDVNRLLKLDPKNTQLLDQKQRLLKDAISDTNAKLQILNDTNADMKKSAANYDQWKAAYDPIQEQIDSTKKKLKELRDQQAEMKDCGEVDTDAYQQLTEEIQNTSKELRDLKKQAQEVTDHFGNPASPEQFDALQREIVATQQDLKKLENEAEDAEKKLNGIDEKPVDDVADAAKRAADALDDAGDKATTFGDVLKAEAIVEGAKGIISSLKDVAEETKDYRKMMGSLEVSSEAAGFTADQTGEAYKRLYGILADDQSAVTTVANLQAVARGQEDVMELIDLASGAWAKYGDSIPIEGLAEAINETAKTGQVTGTFADVLNWGAKEGESFRLQLKDITALEREYEALTAKGTDTQEEYIKQLKTKMATCESIEELMALQESYNAATAEGSETGEEYVAQLKAQIDAGNAWNKSITESVAAEDMFNIALQQCSTESERLDLIMQTLRDQGLTKLSDKWRENNASMVESNETSAELQEQLAELGEKIEPLVTRLTELAIKALDWFNNLGPGTQNFILATVAIVAALGPVGLAISGVSDILDLLSGEKLPGLSSAFGTITGTVLPGVQSAFTSVFSFIAANPIVWIIAAVAGAVVAIAKHGDEIQAGLQKVDDFLQGVFAKDWTEVFGPVLGGSLNDFFGAVKELWDALKQILDGIIDFIRGVFTGDWERAWDGVVKIFSGILDGMIAVAKAPINGVISLINGALRGINLVIEGINKIPDVNIPTIPEIPKLADGGEVLRGSAIVGEAGPELLTVLGDRTVVQPLTGNTTHNSTHLGGVTMVVYGAPGQNVRELAHIVLDEIQGIYDSEEAGL